jgi:lipopolysaccharide transport system ATP-binding protein
MAGVPIPYAHTRTTVQTFIQDRAMIEADKNSGLLKGDTVICVNNVSKVYQLYADPMDRLKQSLWQSLPTFIRRQEKEFCRDFSALNHISLEVARGEAFGIIGRNGSGKSTLLQIIAGTLTPTAGEVYVRGSVNALLELGSGFNPEFTGRENVYMNGAIVGFTAEQMDARFGQIEAFADIGEFIEQPVKTYSSGMFVRLAFAVQTCLDPDILLIDEALAVGDIFFRQKCYQRLEELKKRGCAIILVSHGMNEVEQFCRRALLLDHGKPAFLGPASEAVKHYYLIEQEHSLKEMHAASAAPAPDAALDSDRCIRDEHFWPSAASFLDITGISQIGTGWAKCTAIAICDNRGKACFSFQQGETVSFYYEFELLHDIEVPVAGVVLQNQKGINVHGKSTLEYGSDVPHMVKQGSRIRFRQDITLELEIGEYTVGEIGIATITKNDFKNRGSYVHEELAKRQVRLCHLSLPYLIAVLFRRNGQPVQLLHHGVANLPGACSVFVVNNTQQDIS